MWKPFIVLRKKTLLRLRFWIDRKEKESLIKFPSAKDFLSKADEVYEKILESERINDQQKLEYWRGARSIIDWINEYGQTNEERNTN